jgi:hypothetical protein
MRDFYAEEAEHHTLVGFPVTRTAKVFLHWLVSSPSNHSPRGQRFSLPARFDHQGDDWTNDAWSLVVDVEGVPDALGNQIGTARFLVSSAPHDWLSEGKRFTLFEGRLPIAEGEIKCA